MAQDPARFLTADCDKGKVVQSNQTSQAKGFLDGIGKVGQLGVLNDVGFGSVRNGLSVLSQVSNSIRVGQSVVPGQEGTSLYNSTLGKITSIALTDVDKGASAVLDTTGIGASTLATANSLNPNVANIAYGQAKSVFQQVKQGKFTINQIPDAFQDLQQLETLAKGIFTGSPVNSQTQIVQCEASPFAIDLIAHAPKQKFLFVVQFIFNAPYSSNFDSYGRGTAFVVKQSSRPGVTFEYDEVNEYNYRTRVPKRTIYSAMSMSFYDDNTNNVTNFFNSYLQAHSPIANIGASTNPDGTVNQAQSPTPGMYAMDSMNDALTSSVSSASFGPLKNNNLTFIQTVRLFHVFDYGNSMTVYNFYNPKITRMTPDDLTMMETGNGSEMQFEFEYDGLFIIPNYSLRNKSPFNIQDLTSGGRYPIIPLFNNNKLTTNPNTSLSSITGSGVTGALPAPASITSLQAQADNAQAAFNISQRSGASTTDQIAAADKAGDAQLAYAAALQQKANNLKTLGG